MQPPLPSSTDAAPVSEAERIRALDAVRGFALLGILMINIGGMAGFERTYDDPTIMGKATQLNVALWTVLHVFVEGKMRCLFSMVFGGSLILLTSRLEAKGQGSADIYYRRTLWLLVFGLAHAYLFWSGDILYPYALCALVLYPFRKLSARSLLIFGAVLICVNSALYINKGFDTRRTLREGQAALAASDAGRKLTERQQSAKDDYEAFRQANRPTAEELERDARHWRGSPLRVLEARAERVTGSHEESLYSPTSQNWDIWCMMFIGMALMKRGVLTGERDNPFYSRLAFMSYGVGIPMNAITAWIVIRSRFDPATEDFTSGAYDVGRLAIALGHMSVIVLLVKSGALGWLASSLASSLAAVGRMALSNYIFQSIVTSIVFTGYGFKLYGTLEPYQLYYIIIPLWIFQMIASPLWLRYYRFGPLEWCWRSLTYWKKQPMLRAEHAA
jgi:uncharacterized protein